MAGIRFGAGNAPAGALGIDIDIIPTPVLLIKGFEGYAMSVRSFREPLTMAIDKVIIPSIRKNFTKQGRPERWKALSPYTKEIRQKEGYPRNRPILVRSGKLKRAATARARWVITGDKAYAGGAWPATVFYGPILQTGFDGYKKAAAEVAAGGIATSRAGKLEPRPFMLIQDEDDAKIDYIFQTWLLARAKMVGL